MLNTSLLQHKRKLLKKYKQEISILVSCTIVHVLVLAAFFWSEQQRGLVMSTSFSGLNSFSPIIIVEPRQQHAVYTSTTTTISNAQRVLPHNKATVSAPSGKKVAKVSKAVSAPTPKHQKNHPVSTKKVALKAAVAQNTHAQTVIKDVVKEEMRWTTVVQKPVPPTTAKLDTKAKKAEKKPKKLLVQQCAEKQQEKKQEQELTPLPIERAVPIEQQVEQQVEQPVQLEQEVMEIPIAREVSTQGYYEHIQEEILAHWSPPTGIRPQKRSEVRVIVAATGVPTVKIAQSSGIRVFDTAMYQAARKAKYPKCTWGKELILVFYEGELC